MRLEAPRFGALHLLAHASNAARVHHVVGKRPFLDQAFEARPIDAGLDGPGESRAHLRLIAVADRLDQEVAQRAPIELKFAEYIEDLATERATCFFQLLEQPAIDVALTSLRRHQIPQEADLLLANAVDTAKTLLDAVRIPRQVVVHHQVRALEVDAFAGGIGCEQDLHFGKAQEALLCLASLFAPNAAVDQYHRLGASQERANLTLEIGEGVAMLGEDHNLFMRGRDWSRDRARTVRKRSLCNLSGQCGGREDLAQQVCKLAPLGVLAAASHFGSQCLEAG